MESEELWSWFGLSYASFLVLPRVLMHQMPTEWQDKMAALLQEYEEYFPNQPDISTRVQCVVDGKLSKFPHWLLEYRRPNIEEIEKVKYPMAITRPDQIAETRRPPVVKPLAPTKPTK